MLRVDLSWLIATLLVSVRVAAATAMAPIFGPANVPGAVRVLLSLALGAYFVSTLTTIPIEVGSLGQFVVAVLGEAIVGLAFGFGFLAAYAATQIAGRALDIQIGFGAAGILNPATQTFSPLIGSLFGMAMIAVFLALDGHHILIRALAVSVQQFPPGGTPTLDFGLIVQQSAVMFSFGLALAAPVMFILWLTDITMAVLARSMPQLNVFMLSFSIKILLGTIGLALSIQATQMLFDDLYTSTFRFWDALSTAR